jgi:hypothetical protein
MPTRTRPVSAAASVTRAITRAWTAGSRTNPN